MMILNKAYLILIAISFFTSSCSILPVSDDTKNTFSKIKSLILEDEERFQLYEAELLKDKKVDSYVQRALAAILNNYPIKNVKIFVVDTFEAQAVATVERSIYISKGMLYAIRDEAELMAVLSHEVAHLQLNHLDENKKEISTDVIEAVIGRELPRDIENSAKDIYYSQFNQKNEQEADEFGVMTANQLGYDPYAFVDLLNRLDKISDESVSKKLNNFVGSHKRLKARASHIEDYLKSKEIAKKGYLNADTYLKNMAHLGESIKSSSYQKAQTDLLQLKQRLEAKIKLQQNLSFDEFLSYMRQVKTIAKDLDLLSQIVFDSRHSKKNVDSFFMMESVKVLTPWWVPSNKNFESIKDLLTTLGRVGVGSIPFVGDAIDFYELLTGRDFFNEKALSFAERVSSAMGVFAGSGKQWRSVNKELEKLGGEVVSKAIDAKEVSKVAKVVEEAIEEAPIFNKVKNTDELKDLQNKYRMIKNEKSYEKLKELAEITHQKKIPNDWRVKISKAKTKDDKLQGLEYVHPDNDHIRIRVMPGDPNAKWPNSIEPYVTQSAHGKYIDKFVNITKERGDASHIPLIEYKFKDFWTKYGRK